MANVILNLPMPVLNGPGAAVDVSTMGRDKTVVIVGDFPGATITLEVSQEAGGAGAFAPVYTFTTGDQQRVIPLAARYLRVNVQNRKATVPFTAAADVAADDMGATFATIALPAGNGPGAATNISSLGQFCTFVVGGAFPGASILLEVSDDGTDFAPLVQFTGYGGQTSQVVTAEFCRANVSGRNDVRPFAATIAVGAIIDPVNPPAQVPIPGGSTCYIFQPGGGQTGPGTFDTWPALMTALALARTQANGGGCYTIQFDDSIVSPAVIPAGGPYSMADVTWEGRAAGFGANVSIAAGATFTKLRAFTGNLIIVNHNVAAPAVADLASGDVITLHATTIETVAGGKAMFDATAAGAGAVVIALLYETSSLGVTQTGPVFNFPNGGGATLFVGKEGVSSIAVPGCLVGAVGAVLTIATSSLQSVETVFPNWLGTVSTPRLDVPPSLLPHPYLGAVAAANYTAAMSQWGRFTTAAGNITQTLPKISTATGSFSGPGCFYLASESSGTNVLTLSPAAGDTIQGLATAACPAGGSILLISDGVSNWTIVAAFATGGTSAGASTCLIYQPGGTATGPGTFSSWTALMTRLTALRASANGGGCYTIQFDASLSSPATIPAGGPYNMADVTWEGTPIGFGTAVAIADGASFSKLKSFRGNLDVLNRNTATPACADLASGDILTLRSTTLETVAGGKALYDLTAAGAGAFVILQMYESSSLGSQTGPVFNFPLGAGSELFIVKEGVSSIAVPGCLVGVAGAVLAIATSSLQSVETVFPNWAGTVSTPRLDIPPSLVPRPYLGTPGIASYTPSASQWGRFTTAAGSVTQALPRIATAPSTFSGPGCFYLISNASGANTLSITPGASNTINGSAATISCPAGGAMLFISDGVSDWTVVSQYGNQRLSPPEKWVQLAVPANQNNVAMNALVSVNFTTVRMIRAGSITGLSTQLSAAVTQGTATVKATINGVATTLNVTNALGATASGNQATERSGIDSFAAGALIGMQISTTADFLPITTNLEAWLEIEEVP